MKSQTDQDYQAKDYPISKIVECLSGNSGLTEQVIYQNILVEGERYLVLSSSTEEETKLGKIPICQLKRGKPLKVFEDKEGILVIRNGKAGTTFFLERGKYAITDHAYILNLRDDCPYKVSLKWLMVQHRSRFLEYSSSSANGTWNMTGFFENVRVDIPISEKQNQVVEAYEKLARLSEKIDVICHAINDARNKQLGYPFANFQGKDVPISEILSFQGGNSGLTEEYLYSQIQAVSEKKYSILTGSTDQSVAIYTHRCEHPKNSTKLISVIEDKPVIHVVRKGKAGTTAYFEKGNYTATDDTYLLFLRETPQKTMANSQRKPLQVNLKWLMYELKSRFFDYATSSDNGTWNKGKFFKEVRVDIPSYPEQNKIVEVYDELDGLQKRMEKLRTEIEALLMKQIAQD